MFAKRFVGSYGFICLYDLCLIEKITLDLYNIQLPSLTHCNDVCRLPLTVVMSVTLLSLAAGVLGIVSNLTNVNIIVFVPPNFFQEVNLFINDSSRVKLDVSRSPKSTRVQLFGKPHASLCMLAAQIISDIPQQCFTIPLRAPGFYST